MSAVMILTPVTGQAGLNTSGLDAPQLLDDDKFSVETTAWGGGSVNFSRKKTRRSEIIRPLSVSAYTLTINGEYHAMDHVVDGVFQYPFAKLERWKRSFFKLVMEWPGANKPWAVESVLEGVFEPGAAQPSIPELVNRFGPETLQWYLQDVTPSFEEYFKSTPQVVQFTIKLLEAKEGL